MTAEVGVFLYHSWLMAAVFVTLHVGALALPWVEEFMADLYAIRRSKRSALAFADFLEKYYRGLAKRSALVDFLYFLGTDPHPYWKLRVWYIRKLAEWLHR